MASRLSEVPATVMAGRPEERASGARTPPGFRGHQALRGRVVDVDPGGDARGVVGTGRRRGRRDDRAASAPAAASAATVAGPHGEQQVLGQGVRGRGGTVHGGRAGASGGVRRLSAASHHQGRR